MLKQSNTEHETEKESITPTIDSVIDVPTDSAAADKSTRKVYYAEIYQTLTFSPPPLKKSR